jgi:hypothetical protein
MNRALLQFLFLLAIILPFACTEEANPDYDTSNFTRIYDNNQFDSAFYPLDLKQTSDGGYLLLASKRINGEFPGVYLMKVDENGVFISENSLSSDFVNTSGELLQRNDLFYFFCMDAATKGSILIAVDETLNIQATHQLSLTYPCASGSDDDNFILLGYDHVNRVTTLSIVSEAGAIVRHQNFNIGVGGEEQTEEDVLNSLFQYGDRLPYFVGRIPGGFYYFNGFYNYTFSLVFTSLSSDNPNGLIQGQHNEGGFSAALPLSGTSFAASIFNFGDNFILPNREFTISSSIPGIAVDLGGYTLPELMPNANIRIINATVNNKSVVIYAGDTRSKQIGLWFYDQATGQLLSSRYLGFSNPFEIGNLIQTSDGGLAITGTTYMAGRFPRVCLFKISNEEISQQAE